MADQIMESTSKQNQETFDKISDYVGAEVTASIKDYEFLIELNKTATNSFRDYNSIADKISKNINRINENQMAQARLDNLVQSLDQLESKVTSLESLAYKIDAYSMRLENNFKKLLDTTSNPDTQASQSSLQQS